MSQQQHTPGPWFIDRKFPLSIMAPDREGEPPWHVAAIMDPCGDGGTPEAEANARLIAAAPDMLAALKIVREEYRNELRNFPPDEDEGDRTQEMLAIVAAAIAKAEGAP